MKTVNILSFMAILIWSCALCFTACHQELADSAGSGSVVARITARIASETRAAGTSWANGDAIGISTDHQQTSYTNIKYITDGGDGNFTGTPIYFQDAQSSVTFSAYYPFSGTEGTGAGVLQNTTGIDNQSAENQPDIDYLWATAEASQNQPSVSFNFSHRMCQLTLAFQDGAGTDVSGITAYTLQGLKLQGTFNTATGVAAAKDDAQAEDLEVTVSGSVTSGSALPSLILYPQTTTGKLTLSITNQGKTYSCDLGEAGTQLTQGNDYQYTITLAKEQFKVTQSNIAPWNTVKHTGTATLDETN